MFRHTVVRSAMILTLANIITRLLGFFYRVFMSNAIGAEGMGLYQLISPIYMLVWAFSSAGLSTSVSKLTAEQKAKNAYGNMHRILLTAGSISVALSLVASVVVYFGAPYICTFLLKDTRTLLSMRILAICFPFMAAGSCIRGWFFGMQEAKVPAQCQVLEQCTRMLVVYILSFSMLGKGLEAACAMAVIGMAAGEIISCVYVLFRAVARKHHMVRAELSYRRIGMMIACLAIPLTLNRVTGSLLSSAENFLIPSRLELYGLPRSEAVSLYGQLCGMAMPLVMFPSSLLTALATALMPAVSEASAGGRMRTLSSAIEKSLTFTAVIGIGTAGLFMTLPDELGMVIYGQENIGVMLRLLGVICPFIYFQVTLSGILNGLGKQVFIFLANLLSSVFNILFVIIFVPMYGIEAYIFGWFLCAVVTACASCFVVSSEVKTGLYLNNILLKPLAAISLACLTLKLVVERAGISLFQVKGLIGAMVFIGSMYVVLILLLGVVPGKARE